MGIKGLNIGLLLYAHLLFAQNTIDVVGNLPDVVSESSGLVFLDGRLVTHGDSGNEARLYELDTVSLQVAREVVLGNAQNVDWEDIAQDAEYIYIGDFGNNQGTRRDLTIYRVSKAAYRSSDQVEAEAIHFSYPEQEDFTDMGNSDWDAEALIVFGDQLVVFTKQWVSQGTIAYAVPKVPGTYEAISLGSYAVGGVLTGATYNQESGIIYATAYSGTLVPFLVKMEGFSADSPFDGTIQKIDLDIGLAQIEGITHVASNSYFFSSEAVSINFPPIELASRLFFFSETQENGGEVGNPDNGGSTGDGSPDGLWEKGTYIVFRPLGSRQLGFRLGTDEVPIGYAIFDVTGKRLQTGTQMELEDFSIDVSALGPSYYYLTVYLQGERRTKAFFKD
ncbi:MAG: hypothetical protein AAGA86_06975 [Bacteroidota bacterium]